MHPLIHSALASRETRSARTAALSPSGGEGSLAPSPLWGGGGGGGHRRETMAKQGLTYEQHEIGAAYESLARTVTESDICAFVNLCGFNEPLFYDMEFVATSSVFKGKPAPGAFTFCLSEGLVMQTGLIHGTGMSYLGSEIRTVAPVVVGDTLHVRVVITDKRETKKADRGIVTYKHEVLNHRGELVLEATIKRMIRRAAATS